MNARRPQKQILGGRRQLAKRAQCGGFCCAGLLYKSAAGGRAFTKVGAQIGRLSEA